MEIDDTIRKGTVQTSDRAQEYEMEMDDTIRKGTVQTPDRAAQYLKVLEKGFRQTTIETQMKLDSIFENKNIPDALQLYAFRDTYAKAPLGPIARGSLEIPNAGGKSEVSEAHSIHMMCACFGATQVLYENQVSYWAEICFGKGSKMVDYVCTIAGQRVGVSVTRAMAFPTRRPELYTQEQADRLVAKKVHGLIVSREAVTEHHSFTKSILHVWCQTKRIADMVISSFRQYEEKDTTCPGVLILLATVCNDREIFTNHFVCSVKQRFPRHLQKKQKKQKGQKPWLQTQCHRAL